MNKNITKLAWPVVVIIVLFLFRSQIGSQFDRLTGVSVAAFSVVLQNTAKSKNNEAAYGIIKGLTKEGIIALLDSGDKTMILTSRYENSLYLDDNFNGFVDLEKNNLLKTNIKLEDFDSSNPQQALTAAGIQDIEVELNTKGKHAWDIIAESVNTALNP